MVDCVRAQGCQLAVLKSKSPSCGNGLIYDGTFTGTLVAGYGVAARALRAEGVRVLDENQLRACVAASVALAIRARCPPCSRRRPRSALRSKPSALCCAPLAQGGHRRRVRVLQAIPPSGRTPGGRRIARARMRASSWKRSLRHRTCSAYSSVSRTVHAGRASARSALSATPQRRNVDCLMLGYALAKRAWGRGYVTEAAREMIRFGFDELGLLLVSCTCYPFNDRSRRVIEKCGFSREGVLHAAEPSHDGTLQDLLLYCLAREDWRAERA
ncbi:GNAT family N-acetyltransferase [Paraeggerthella sp.]|uniref:GNAT family N-acetyltransferase n=1 Tax=Paraeggerthella sp. TaxID=2897350 RepID=UPI0035277DE8